MHNTTLRGTIHWNHHAVSQQKEAKCTEEGVCFSNLYKVTTWDRGSAVIGVSQFEGTAQAREKELLSHSAFTIDPTAALLSLLCSIKGGLESASYDLVEQRGNTVFMTTSPSGS